MLVVSEETVIWNSSNYFAYLASFITVGSFVIIDLIAATTNALNGALLAQRPDYYRGRQWSIVGILLLAIFGGIGGGVSRDVLLNKVPGALSNPWYLILCLLAGVVGMLISYKGGQKFRETFYQFMTAFSLPWYAAIGVSAALDCRPARHRRHRHRRRRPDRRPLPDRHHRRPLGQAVHPRRVVRRDGRADLESSILICSKYLGLTIWPATLISFVVGFFVPDRGPVVRLGRAAAQAAANMSSAKVTRRETLKEKMAPGWEPKYE